MGSDRREKILVNKQVQVIFTGVTLFFLLVIIIITAGITYFITFNTLISQLISIKSVVNISSILNKLHTTLLIRLICMGALLIILVFYLEVRFLHRIVGPLVRIERALREISEGKDIEPIKIRKTDYYQSLADSVNKLIDYIKTIKKS
jgi:HAMP domain-containing protein